MIRFPDVALGSIVAAIIAAAVSLLGLIISKELKVSDLRQQWIDALRADIARLIAHANAVHGATIAPAVAQKEQWDRVRLDYLGMNEATAAIRLRLNPEEEPSAAVLKKMTELEALFIGGGFRDHTKLVVIERDLVDLSKKVLKSEWLRVRKGETVFRVARLTATLMTATLMLTALVIMADSARDKSRAPSATEKVN